MNFTETLNKHIRAIQTRDLPALIETLPAEQLTLVMSDGRLVRSVREFLAAHQDWFQSSTWSIRTEVVQLVEEGDLGLAVLHLDYRDQPPDGKPVHETSFLTLVFQRQGEHWVMIHDQNTPIRRPA